MFLNLVILKGNDFAFFKGKTEWNFKIERIYQSKILNTKDLEKLKELNNKFNKNFEVLKEL